MSIYDDGRTRLDADGILLRRYYFPLARPKRMAWAQVRGVRSAPLRLVNGRWRLWGSGTPRVWLGLDGHRPKRTTLITLDVGRRIRPAFTPEDPPTALACLHEHVTVEEMPTTSDG